MRWRCALLAVAVLAGCGSEGGASPAPVRNAEHRFTAVVPAGWELAGESLTPSLTNPVEILLASTIEDVRPTRGACAHQPVGALERMGPRDELEEYWFEFSDANRGFHVHVAFGPDAPAVRREQALALLRARARNSSATRARS